MNVDAETLRSIGRSYNVSAAMSKADPLNPDLLGGEGMVVEIDET